MRFLIFFSNFHIFDNFDIFDIFDVYDVFDIFDIFGTGISQRFGCFAVVQGASFPQEERRTAEPIRATAGIHPSPHHPMTSTWRNSISLPQASVSQHQQQLKGEQSLLDQLESKLSTASTVNEESNIVMDKLPRGFFIYYLKFSRFLQFWSFL